MILTKAPVIASALSTSMVQFGALQPVPWVNLCGTLAPLASLWVCAAPLPTIRQVTQDRTTGKLPLLPYTCTIVSTFAWVTYGILRNEPKIWSTNMFGLLLGLYYFLQFTRFSPKQSPSLPGSIRQHVEGSLAIMIGTLLAAVTLKASAAASAIGALCVIMCIAMFASPLSALKTVLQTKSAQSIPLPFTLAAVANCFLWSVVGIFEMKDFTVILPNMLGLASGLTQLFLKILYGNGRAPVEYGMAM